MDAEDIIELQSLLQQAKRPQVRAILEKAIAQGPVPISAPQEQKPQPAPAAVTAAAPPSSSAPSSSAPSSVSSASSSVHFEGITKGYGWEQNRDDIEVLIFEGVEGVGALPKENVQVDFSKQGIDVRIFGLHNGKTNKRLLIDNLEKEIDVAKCSFKVSKNRIKLVLKKMAPYGYPDHWMDLLAKKKKPVSKDAAGAGGSGGGDGDPSEGIMQVMRDLYEDGDDQTRKIIAEAWTKSRESQAKGVGKRDVASALGGGGDSSFGSSGFGDGIDDL